MYYTMADAKRDFRLGFLDIYYLERNVLAPGWRIQLVPARSSNSHPLVDARSKEWRLFKTLDAAVAALEEIGFKVVSLGSAGR